MADTAQPIPGRRLLFTLLVVFLIAVVPAVVVPTLMCRPEEKPPEDLGEVTAFSLVDQTGASFTEAALRGQVTIVSFIFTRCDTICPVINAHVTAELVPNAELHLTSNDGHFSIVTHVGEVLAEMIGG